MSHGSNSNQNLMVNEKVSPSLTKNHYRASNLYKARDKSVNIMFKPSSGVEKTPNKHYMTTFKQIQTSKKSQHEKHLLPSVQPVTLKNERQFNSTRNAKVSVLALNTNAAPLKQPNH